MEIVTKETLGKAIQMCNKSKNYKVYINLTNIQRPTALTFLISYCTFAPNDNVIWHFAKDGRHVDLEFGNGSHIYFVVQGKIRVGDATIYDMYFYPPFDEILYEEGSDMEVVNFIAGFTKDKHNPFRPFEPFENKPLDDFIDSLTVTENHSKI